MSGKKQHINANRSFLTMFLAVFMLSFILSPMIYIICKQLDSNKRISESQSENNDETYHYNKYPSILFNLPEKDYFKDVIRNSISPISSRRYLFKRSFDEVLPKLFLGLTAGFYVLSIRKTKKNKAVIDFLLGGHAPPFAVL